MLIEQLDNMDELLLNETEMEASAPEMESDDEQSASEPEEEEAGDDVDGEEEEAA